MVHSDVLIVGAGPTGLVLALWLAKLGLKSRIIDKTAEPGTTSRALAVAADRSRSAAPWRALMRCARAPYHERRYREKAPKPLVEPAPLG